MIRQTLSPRTDWQSKVESVGLIFHTIDGAPYWDESACYQLSASEVDTLEAAANEVHLRCLDAAQAIIDRKLWQSMAIPEAAISEIEQSWRLDDASIYGRFDFAWDGVSPPQLLEYNADTPTALLEASVVQWHWLQEVQPDADQFNSIHERLIAAWKKLDADSVHFASVADSTEDGMTALYLRDTCEQAGKQTASLDMSEIGWNRQAKRFVDPDGRFIDKLFKLYPWEWMWDEEFGAHITGQGHHFIEPVWKMMLSNKAILPLLWEMFPHHPNLLPAFHQPEPLRGNYIRKPKLSREGANIEWRQNDHVLESSDGEYGEDGYIYQAPATMPCHDGNYPVFGVWMIDGEAAGLGIREDRRRITSNLSRFVPHFFR
jgi:glutathionylspermidine synthase